MTVAIRWILVAVAALAIVALIAFARGEEHQRGRNTGALPVALASASTGHG
jgi:hypothetical protein